MVNIKRMTTKRLGELLVEERLLTQDQVDDALREQAESGNLLGEVLVALGYLTEYDIAQCICLQFNLPFIHVSCYQIRDECVHMVPLDLQRDNQLIVLDRIGNVIILAIAGLLKENVFNYLAELTDSELQIYVSTTTDILKALTEYQQREDVR